MKSFALAAVIFLVAMAAHAALYEVTIDGNKYQLSSDEEHEVTLTDGRRASVVVSTLGDVIVARIDGTRLYLEKDKGSEVTLKDGRRVIVSVAAVEGVPKVFQGYGISFRYPSNVEFSQESDPESAIVIIQDNGVGLRIAIFFQQTPTKETMDTLRNLSVNYIYKEAAKSGARFPKNWIKTSRRSVGGVAIEGVTMSYYDGFETLHEIYLMPHNGRILKIDIFMNNPERKARIDSLINFVLDSLI
ncbi:MAG: hypothetical protein CVU20_13980 [Betaproteobacteria bacterium HGW-Betaproteobacteria-14]|nr:MAG: hypothetical protein CVU20_13980 [Betaproteobacteria bacterium HGW-Betaproteobacteria-14]